MTKINKAVFILTALAASYCSYASENLKKLSEDLTPCSDSFTIPIMPTFAKPTSAVALDKMNVLYIGVDNPITVATSAGEDDKINVSISGAGGFISKVGVGKYVVRVATLSDECVISVSASGKQVGLYQFRTRRIPLPTATVAGYNLGDSVLAAAFKGQAGVSAYLNDFPFDVYYEITSFTLSIQGGNGQVHSINNDGAKFSAETVSLMKEYLQQGTVITIGNLSAKGPDGRSMKLLPLLYFIK